MIHECRPELGKVAGVLIRTSISSTEVEIFSTEAHIDFTKTAAPWSNFCKFTIICRKYKQTFLVTDEK